MSPERELAQLVAHPWTEYRKGDKTYYGVECQMAYSAKVNQLAAICELHRRTPLTKELMELNGFELGGIDGDAYFFVESSNVNVVLFDSGATAYADGYNEWPICRLSTVADLENLLDLIGIDKQIKLPKPHDEE